MNLQPSPDNSSKVVPIMGTAALMLFGAKDYHIISVRRSHYSHLSVLRLFNYKTFSQLIDGLSTTASVN